MRLPKANVFNLVCLPKCPLRDVLQVLYRNEGPDVAFILWDKDVEICKNLKSCLGFVLTFNKLLCRKLALK